MVLVKLDVVVQACDPSTQETEARKIWKKAVLGYTMSLRSAQATRDLVSLEKDLHMSTSSILTLCKPLVTGVSTLLQRLKLEALTAFIHDVINNNQTAAFVPCQKKALTVFKAACNSYWKKDAEFKQILI